MSSLPRPNLALVELAADAEPTDLTDIQRQILAIEKRWWKYTAVKERTIKAQLGLNPTQYYLALNSLLDNPAAAAAEPMLINRLRTKRAA